MTKPNQKQKKDQQLIEQSSSSDAQINRWEIGNRFIEYLFLVSYLK